MPKDTDRGQPDTLRVAAPDESDDRTPQREDFVRALTWLLKERGISQRELAARLGRASYTPFYRWFELKTEPQPAEVFAIERLLDVPPGTLSRHLGYLPPEARSSAPAGASFDEAVQSDPNLNELGRRTLRAVYAEMTRKQPASKRARR